MDELLGTPFLNRKMLAFEQGSAFALRISSQSISAGSLTIRGMTRAGIFTYTHQTNTTGLIQTELFALPDLPIMVSVVDETGSISEGDCYVTLSLLANGDKLHELAAGYVYQSKSISFPASIAQPHRIDCAHLLNVAANDPAAGGELTITVPNGTQWEVLGLNFDLQTSATVANRRVHVILGASGTLYLNCFGNQNQAASLTRHYTCTPIGVIPTETDDDDIIIPMPPGIFLDQGMKITTQTTNRQAGDQFSGMTMLVKSTITPSS